MRDGYGHDDSDEVDNYAMHEVRDDEWIQDNASTIGILSNLKNESNPTSI